MRFGFYYLLAFGSTLLVASSCSVSDTKLEHETKEKEITKNREKVNLNEFLVSVPKKKTERELMKAYMPGGKTSSDWHDYNKGADCAMIVHDYASAERLLEKSIKLDPNNSTTYYMLGRTKFNSLDDRNDEAALDIEMAIRLGEKGNGAFETLASIYDTKKDTAKAIDVLTRGIKICSKKKHLYHSRAAIYVATGEKEKALQDYTELIRISPDYARVYIVRGQLYEELGQSEKALNDYLQAANNDSKESIISSFDIALKFRAALLDKLGRHKEAIKDLDRVLKARPNDDEVLRLRGDQYLVLKNYRKAIADFTKSIEAAPEFAHSAYEGRSKAYEAIGKKDLALSDMSKAAKMNAKPAEKPLY